MKLVGWCRRVAASLPVVALLLGTVAATPAAAGGTESRHDRDGGRIEVDFDIDGELCRVEPIEEKTRRHRSVVRQTRTGSVTSDIGLFTGQLTVEITTVFRKDGSATSRGRWWMEPSVSNGSIEGRVRGATDESGRSEAAWSGRGRDVLRGISVDLETVGGPATSCDAGATLTGHGTATARPERAPRGAVVATSIRSFDESVSALTDAIETNPNLNLVRTVDHRAAAASRQLVLGPTTELFFGNPDIGTPLMQAAQSTGIDLPQKMLVWEDPLGIVRVAYNSPSYLRSRHDIVGADARLETVANALASLASVATGTTVDPVVEAGRVPVGAGLVTIETDRSPEEAFAAIVAALRAAPPVNVAIVLEHDANAARVGLDLDPTKLVVFGNPSLGTGLMRSHQSVALDLPQKILVTRTGAGTTRITWNDPAWVARRHGIGGQDELLDTLAGALANFASVGT